MPARDTQEPTAHALHDRFHCLVNRPAVIGIDFPANAVEGGMGAALPTRAHFVQIVSDAERERCVTRLDRLRDFPGPQERTRIHGHERTSRKELRESLGLPTSLGTEPYPGQTPVVD